MIAACAILAGLLVTALLSLGSFARSTGWRATVTPLARGFGSAAVGAMAALLRIWVRKD